VPTSRTWTLWLRRRWKDGLEQGDTFDSLESAKETADEMIDYHRYAEAEVMDATGGTVYRRKRE
jgi:hypothetical protein